MNKPISEFNEELEAFRRLPARERIEQLTLKLETDEAFVAEFNDAGAMANYTMFVPASGTRKSSHATARGVNTVKTT